MKVSLLAIFLLSLFTLTTSANNTDWKSELTKYKSWNKHKINANIQRNIADSSKPVPVSPERMPAKIRGKITPKELDHKNVDLTYKFEEKDEL